MERIINYKQCGTDDKLKLRIFTDGWNSYNFLDSMPNVFHGVLNHDNGDFGTKKFHSNTIENRWS